MTDPWQQQDALGFVRLVKRHFDRASMSLPYEVWEQMEAILAGEGGQQSNPATLREALAIVAEEMQGALSARTGLVHKDYIKRWLEMIELAASGTEAAPPDKIKCYLTREQFDAMMSGKFNQPAQAAASPDAAPRDSDLGSFNDRYHEGYQNGCIDTEIMTGHDFPLRQSAAPSGGDLDTPSKLSGSMAIASGNAGVVMDAHRQIVKAEIAEARLDEALEIRKNFHGMAAGLTFGNLMDFVKWLDKHVSELEHAVAMTDEAPQQLQAESKTGAVTDAQAGRGQPVGSVGLDTQRSTVSGDSASIPESGETGAVTETK